MSNGDRQRHPLSRVGNRELKNSLHMMAVTEIRDWHATGRAGVAMAEVFLPRPAPLPEQAFRHHESSDLVTGRVMPLPASEDLQGSNRYPTPRMVWM